MTKVRRLVPDEVIGWLPGAVLMVGDGAGGAVCAVRNFAPATRVSQPAAWVLGLTGTVAY